MRVTPIWLHFACILKLKWFFLLILLNYRDVIGSNTKANSNGYNKKDIQYPSNLLYKKKLFHTTVHTELTCFPIQK